MEVNISVLDIFQYKASTNSYDLHNRERQTARIRGREPGGVEGTCVVQLPSHLLHHTEPFMSLCVCVCVYVRQGHMDVHMPWRCQKLTHSPSKILICQQEPLTVKIGLYVI